MIKRKIYLASSWRNEQYDGVLSLLELVGHKVYDFRRPKPVDELTGTGYAQWGPPATGFSWDEVSAEAGPRPWTRPEYLIALATDTAQAGFKMDMDALNWCDTCVLLLPSGRSAHLEAGYAAGKGKDVFIYLNGDDSSDDLMYLMATSLALSMDGLLTQLSMASPVRLAS